MQCLRLFLNMWKLRMYILVDAESSNDVWQFFMQETLTAVRDAF